MLHRFAIRASAAMLGMIAVTAFAVAPAAASVPAKPADDIGIAAVSVCVVPLNGCQTAAVRPNASGRIAYEVNTGILGCSFRVRDVINGHVIRSGRIYAGTATGNIGGLTNLYRVELYSCSPGNTGLIAG